MKTLTALLKKTLILLLLFAVTGLALKQNSTVAQVPDCTGTVMYALFNDSTGSGTNAPSEIRSVNYVTGAVGPLVGGVTYLIQKAGAGGPYYGSAGLALDPVNKHFFVITQMNNGIPKDIIDINPVGGAMTVIATTPAGISLPNVPDVLSNYHFVKLAVSPGGIGYAIGVHRDTTLGSFTSAKCNPLISFTTCGGGVAVNCSTIKLLGYLSNAFPITTNYRLFNGDIAFDNAGNIYFLTVGFARVAGNGRYTDARLFRISAANIPSVPGTGQIPLSLIADYNGLDSTVGNGIAFNMLGQMFFSTRTFNGPQNNPPVPTFNNVIFRSVSPGVVTPLAGFAVPTAGYSVADLASCNFPAGVLSDVKLVLNGWNESGTARLKWEVNMNNQVAYYELQGCTNGNDFETIARINPSNINSATASYSYTDVKVGVEKIKYYRIKEVIPGGANYYSNIIKINFGSKVQLVNKPNPNPFTSQFDLRLEMKSAGIVAIRLRNQAGALVYQRNVDAVAGENRLSVEGLSSLSKGVYVVEITVDEEVIREKLIKQ